MGDHHTGPRSPRIVTLQQATSTDLDRSQRTIRRAFQAVLKTLFSDENRTIRKGVLDGLVASAAASGDLAVDVTAGLGFVNISTGLDDATLDSSFRWCEIESATTDRALAAADPTNPRIDVVYIEWAYGTQTSEMRNIRPSAGAAAVSTATDVYEGPEITVNIATGTPAGSPAVPSIPANAIKLAHVAVPANATVAGDLTVTDQRTMLPTCQQPQTLADGTAVDGAFDVSGLLTSGSASIGAGNANVLDSTGIVTDSLVVKAAGTSADFYKQTSEANPIIKLNSNVTGSGNGQDAVIEIERGGDTSAKIRYHEDEKRLELDRTFGAYCPLVQGVYKTDGTIWAKGPCMVADMVVKALAGGANDELVDIDITGLPGTTMTPISAVVTAINGAASLAVGGLAGAGSFTHVGAGAMRIRFSVIDVTGGNIAAGNITVSYMALFSYV